MSSSSRSTSMPQRLAPHPRQPRAAAALRIGSVRVVAGRCRRAATPGGTAGRSTESCSTFRARRRASCAGIPTANGCTGRPTSPRFARAAIAAAGRRVAAARARRAACSMRRARCSRRRTRRGSRTSSRDHPDALRESLTFPAPMRAIAAGNSCLRLRGASHNQDGFFYALLRKR